MSTLETVNLTNCDREPIHIPGSIQPHGAMLVCDANAAIVLRHSTNVAEMLGLPQIANGQPFEGLVGEDAVHRLRNALATSGDASRPALLFGLKLTSGRAFDVAIHQFKSNVIIEFEPTLQSNRPLQLAREMIGRIGEIDSVDRLVQQTARLVKGVLGYDRVMIYRFEQDGAGKVIAEVKQPDLESFLGQYFPASDIPQQARALYLKNTIRIISSASGDRVLVEPQIDPSGEPLDLSFAHLRSVSPIHLEYLRNMGVAASMSISVIVEGALWGLIACHHYSPRVLPMAERIAVEMFGEFFSLHLQALKQKRKLDTAREARERLDRFLRLASHHNDIEELLGDNLPDFHQLIPSDGAGVWVNGRWKGQGTTPPPSAMPALVKFVSSVADGKIWGTHTLSRHFPPAEDYADNASGLLAIPLSQIPNDYLFFFRKELTQTLNWAGNPEKSYETGPMGDRLTPRKSFAIWKETVFRQAQPWEDAEREIAEATRAATVEIVLRHNELMADERRKADVRQRMLNEELNHRVKNILAVIKSLVGHPVQEGRTLKEFVASLKGRIQALSFAHDQVVRGEGGGMLTDLLNAELTPYRGQSTAISLNGPPVWLESRAFSVMALVFHELATNAAKYGSLSRSGGQLDVTWTLNEAGDCEIAWRENGGPDVLPPNREGFGSVLIDRSIPFDLNGESSVDYAREGLTARFRLPARHVSLAARGTARLPEAAAQPAAPDTSLDPSTKVLIVEDQMLIAMDLEMMLSDHGITDLTIANSAAEAMTRIKASQPGLAVLDVNLGAGTSIPVAEELMRRGVPFVFATGYGEGSMIPTAFAGVPIVRKPYDADLLLEAIGRVLTSKAG